jgi:hypothetical protein
MDLIQKVVTLFNHVCDHSKFYCAVCMCVYLPDCKDEITVYDLVGVICHHGTAGGKDCPHYHFTA